MNTTGCPENIATDEAFRPNLPGACDTNLAGYYFYTLFISALKLVSAVKQFQNWFARPTHRAKVPRGPINSVIFGIVEILLSLLVGVNLINYDNGLSFTVFSIGFLPFAYSYSVGLIRLVSLGEKILPKNSRGEATNLAKFDNWGKALLLFQGISIIMSSFALIILSPILTEHEYIISTIGFATKGAFIAFCILGYIYHFERCIRIIRATQSNVDNIRAVPGQESQKNELNRVVMKMRRNQGIHVFNAGPTMLLYLLFAAGALPASVWLLWLTVLFESLGSIFLEFNIRAPGAKSKPTATNSKPTSKDQIVVGAAVEPEVEADPSVTQSAVGAKE